MSVRVCDVCGKEYVGDDDTRCGRCVISEKVWRERLAVAIDDAVRETPHAPAGWVNGMRAAAALIRTGEVSRPGEGRAHPQVVSYDFGDSSI